MDRWEAEIAGGHVVFGEGTLERLGQLVADCAITRPLVVTDRGIVAAGHVAAAIDSLETSGIEPAVFDAVLHNPDTDNVEAGVAAARDHRADGLIGLGGGSSMDCAKGINFLFTNGGRMEDYWGRNKARTPMLASVGVPTTAGTGSEAQSYAIISQATTGVKMACGDRKARFRAVILDPVLVATAPREVAAVSAVDAVSHAVESYVTSARNPISQLYSREAWRLLESGLEAALERTTESVCWAPMLLGAHLAGAAIEQSMLGAAHAAANPLTARFGLAHGIAVGLMLPHVIRFNADHVGALYEDLRSIAAARQPVEQRVTDLRSTAGLPGRLRDCAVDATALEELAEGAVKQWTASFNPRPAGQKEFLELYEAAF